MSLNDVDREEFRWLKGLGIDNPGDFSRKWCQRWVCKKAYDLGWNEDLFGEFEKFYCNGALYSRSPKRVERIGKKYQWIAFHELLARMSDNLKWIDRGYSDIDDHKFFGPWQLHKRDIDPTLWIRNTGTNGWNNFDKEFWWQPYTYPFAKNKPGEYTKWLWDKRIVPPFKELLSIRNPEDDREWVVLRGFSKWKKEPLEKSDEIPYQEGWYRINSCIIQKQDFEKLKEEIQHKTLCHPDVLHVDGTGHQGYFGEYPWHPYYNYIEDWRIKEEDWQREISIKHHVPVSQYEWETGSVDNSIEESISFYLPSSMLIKELSLSKCEEEPGKWKDKSGDLVFLDPSVACEGPSYGLMRRGILEPWMVDNELMIVWLIGGEKQLFTSGFRSLLGRQVYSGLFNISGKCIFGKMWFEEQRN